MTEITQEPGSGSVVAINWRRPRQEIWVSNSANGGNWYTSDIPLDGSWHPRWEDVIERSKVMRSELTLLVAADSGAYEAGYRAGVDATATMIGEAIDAIRYSPPEGPSTIGDEDAQRS